MLRGWACGAVATPTERVDNESCGRDIEEAEQASDDFVSLVLTILSALPPVIALKLVRRLR